MFTTACRTRFWTQTISLSLLSLTHKRESENDFVIFGGWGKFEKLNIFLNLFFLKSLFDGYSGKGFTSGEWCIVSIYLFTLGQSVHLGSQSGNQLSPSPLVCGHMSTPVNCFDRQAKTVEGTNESLRLAPGGRVEQVTWKTMSRTAWWLRCCGMQRRRTVRRKPPWTSSTQRRKTD